MGGTGGWDQEVTVLQLRVLETVGGWRMVRSFHKGGRFNRGG